jgi:hypothetical protein
MSIQKKIITALLSAKGNTTDHTLIHRAYATAHYLLAHLGLVDETEQKISAQKAAALQSEASKQPPAQTAADYQAQVLAEATAQAMLAFGQERTNIKEKLWAAIKHTNQGIDRVTKDTISLKPTRYDDPSVYRARLSFFIIHWLQMNGYLPLVNEEKNEDGQRGVLAYAVYRLLLFEKGIYQPVMNDKLGKDQTGKILYENGTALDSEEFMKLADAGALKFAFNLRKEQAESPDPSELPIVIITQNDRNELLGNAIAKYIWAKSQKEDADIWQLLQDYIENNKVGPHLWNDIWKFLGKPLS